MPPPGGTKKKKKGRAPKHQNSFAFRHNPKSKKTDKILASPNVGVCGRCHDKIEWRKKYRKYKPRTQPGKCNACGQKNIMAAYHTICTKCAGSEKEIMAMLERYLGSDRQHDESNPAHEQSASCAASPCSSVKATPKSLRRIRVCAMCTNCPALSKYSNASPEDMEIVEELQRLEDMVEDGVHADGHRLTLRETKSLERKIEKLQEELKERKRSRKEKEDGTVNDGREDEGADISSQDGGGEGIEEEEGEEESNSDVDDPFLKLTGGKALVGEEYQKMLLQKQEMAGVR